MDSLVPDNEEDEVKALVPEDDEGDYEPTAPVRQQKRVRGRRQLSDATRRRMADFAEKAAKRQAGEPAPATDKQAKPPGLFGTIGEGAKTAARAVGAAIDTYQGDEAEVVEAAKKQREAPKHPELENFYKAIDEEKKNLGPDPSLWQGIKAVGSAALNNPKGAGLMVAEQIPNSAVAFGSGLAGMGIGSLAGPVGAAAGFVMGMFGGNAALETGHGAMEAAQDGTFSPEEQEQVQRERAIKAGVLTGVDTLTLGMTNFITGSARRAVERATMKTLSDRGVDVTNRAAVQAARDTPEIVEAVQAAQVLARKSATTLGKRVAQTGGAVALETIGEGAGEYLGEYAATGKADVVDAVVESLAGLSMSMGEVAFTSALNKRAMGRLFGSKEEAEEAAKKDTKNTGVDHEVKPHPDQPDKFVAVPKVRSARGVELEQDAEGNLKEVQPDSTQAAFNVANRPGFEHSAEDKLEQHEQRRKNAEAYAKNPLILPGIDTPSAGTPPPAAPAAPSAPTILGRPVTELSTNALIQSVNFGSSRAKKAAQDEMARRDTEGVDPAVANAIETPSEAVNRIIDTGIEKTQEDVQKTATSTARPKEEKPATVEKTPVEVNPEGVTAEQKTEGKKGQSEQFAAYDKHIDKMVDEKTDFAQHKGVREQIATDERLEDGEADTLLKKWDNSHIEHLIRALIKRKPVAKQDMLEGHLEKALLAAKLLLAGGTASPKIFKKAAARFNKDKQTADIINALHEHAVAAHKARTTTTSTAKPDETVVTPKDTEPDDTDEQETEAEEEAKEEVKEEPEEKTTTTSTAKPKEETTAKEEKKDDTPEPETKAQESEPAETAETPETVPEPVAEEAKEETPVAEEKKEEVAEEGKTTTTSTAKPKKPKVEKVETPKEDKSDKFVDVGVKMGGKRADEVAQSLLDGETGNLHKDLQKVLDKTSKAAVWKIELADGATPGTKVYLEAVRGTIRGFTDFYGTLLGGGRERWAKSPLDTLREYAESNMGEIRQDAGAYISMLEQLGDATKGAMNIEQARVALEKALFVLEKGRSLDVSERTNLGKLFNQFMKKDRSAAWYVEPDGLAAEIKDDDSPDVRTKPLLRPTLTNIDRTGMTDWRKGVNIKSSDEFKDKFGFRGVDFGNWVNQKERQLNVNAAYDALMDLAQTLGIEPKQISLGGKLGFGFGARGKGRHSAHYDPTNVLINLTKTKGNGTIAHEWGHALDYAINKSKGGSEVTNDMKSALSMVYNREKIYQQLESILKGTYTQKKKREAIELAQRYIRELWPTKDWGGSKPTDYLENAEAMGGSYWKDPDELWAREFESFIYDTMPGGSPFLVDSWVADNKVTADSGYKGRPYPSGDERAAFHGYFAHLVSGIEWTEEGPAMKEGHALVSKVVRDKLQAELDEYGKDLEKRRLQLLEGDPWPDGLYWYQFYGDGKRGKNAQPKGFFGFDDESNAIGYPEPLDPDDQVNFGMSRAKDGWLPGEKTVYLKDLSDENKLLVSGEEPLGKAPPKDDGETEEESGADDGSGRGSGTGEGHGGGTGGGGGGLRERKRRSDEAVPPASERGGATGAGPGPDAVQPEPGGNYRISDTDRVGEGSIEVKFGDNIKAIKALKQIEAENRLATTEEQAILVRYVGWGGMPQAFAYGDTPGWESRKQMLKDLMTDEEYDTARASTTGSFYTPPAIVSAMWDAVVRMGFKNGRVADPGAGIGHFFGLMPEDMMHASRLTGVELDGLSARIAKQLYQKASIVHNAYEKSLFPQKFFDLFISNVPFSDSNKPVDKTHNKENLNLHDYYFNKSIELTRPGGIIAFITAKGTMDNRDSKARALLDAKAEFIGAIRLPQGAFQENANTGVVADIIFMRRRVEGEKLAETHKWTGTEEVTFPGKTHYGYPLTGTVNEYFVAHPEMIVGNLGVAKNRFGDNVPTVTKKDGDLAGHLQEAIKRLPENIVVETTRADELERAAVSIPAEGDVKEGAYTEKDGKLYVRNGATMMPVDENTPNEKKEGQIIRSSMKLRDTIRRMLRLRMSDSPEAQVKTAKKAIEKEYDAFVKKHGYLNDKANVRAYADDPDAALILAIELWDADSETGKRVEIDFRNRAPITHVETAEDALVVSLGQHGRVDWDVIQKLTGKPLEQVREELAGRVYDDPTEGWVTAEEYLSGNVREKLKVAESAAAADFSFTANVDALKAAQPIDIPPSKIRAMLGAPWIPARTVNAFMEDLLGRSGYIDVHFVPTLGKWSVTPREQYNQAETKRTWNWLKQSTAATTTWGTQNINFVELMDFALNGGFPVVYYPKDALGKTYVNVKQTEAANAKLALIKERFGKWLWETPDRADKMARLYNDTQNAIRLQKFEYPAHASQKNEKGGISLPGMAEGMWLNPHQAAAVWRTITAGNTYYAHDVGTGKTFTIIAAAMELKRLRLAKKPMIAVLNSTVEQFKADFLRLYPGANILVTGISSNASIRKLQMSRIAVSDWDAVIVTHDNFAALPMSEASIQANYQREIDNLTAAVLDAKRTNIPTRVVKELEDAKKVLSNKMQAALEKRKKDDTTTFEELGVDQIFIDEAHTHKNLMFKTSMGRTMRGLNPDGSGIAFDLFMKTNYLNAQYGRGVVLASGTPISNSVGELFSLSRYLQPKELEKRGIQMFDAWAATYGDVGQLAEPLPEGGGLQMVTKFKAFVNIPELMQMVYQVMDSVTADAAKVKRPSVKGGKFDPVLVAQSPVFIEYQKEIKARSLRIRSSPAAAQPDNMLKIVMDGRKAAIDMRLVNPSLPDTPLTKVNVAVDRIHAIYEREEAKKGTQLVFADLGVPGGSLFSIYDDIKAKLIAKGIPADEIAFVYDAKDDRQRKAQFAKVNSGKIRVWIASTEKGGTGVNVQKRVAAIHNIDPHWNLANILQRIGRGQRQGNVYDEIEILNYVTEKSVDSFMWGKVRDKGTFIDQIMSGDVSIREAEDISQETMSAGEMAAVASGEPLIQEKFELETAVRKLEYQEAAYKDTLLSVRRQLAAAPQEIARLEKVIKDAEAEAAIYARLTEAVTAGKTYDLTDTEQRKEFSELVIDAADEFVAEAKQDKAELKKRREKDPAYQVPSSRLIGELRGDKAKVTMSVMTNLFYPGGFMSFRSLYGDRVMDAENGFTAQTMNALQNRGLKDAQDSREKIENIKAEIPKLQEEAERKFDKAEQLEAKSKRLTEVINILTNREAEAATETEADAAPSGPQFRYFMEDYEAVAVSKFTDITSDLLPGERFFVFKHDTNYRVIHTRTGRYVTDDYYSEEGAKRELDATISAYGTDRMKERFERYDDLAEDKKEAALNKARKRGVKFSREGAGVAGFSGMPKQKIRSIVDAIKARWKNAPEIVVVDDMDDPLIPEAARVENAKQVAAGATGQPAAFIMGNRVYIVASQVKTNGDVVQALFHEALGHFGLRGLYGAGLDKILHQVAALRRADVEAMAKKYGLDMNNEEDKLTAAEEVLAHLAQTNPQSSFVKRAIAEIRKWLRENIPGFEKMKLTDDEIINHFLIPARQFVQRGRAGFDADAVPVFQRVWHGSPHRFDKFTLEKIGTGEGAQAYGWGLYFAGRRSIAEWYKKKLEKTQQKEQKYHTLDGKEIDRNYLDELQEDKDPLVAKFFKLHGFSILYGSGDVRVQVDIESGYAQKTLDRASGRLEATRKDQSESKWPDMYDKLVKMEEENFAKAEAELKNFEDLKARIDFVERPHKGAGQLYEVEIPEDDTFLLWDAPLSKQTPEVKAALENVRAMLEKADVLENYLEVKNAEWEELTGKELYQQILNRAVSDDVLPTDNPALEDALRRGQSPKAISIYLESVGISGNKYIDGVSRNKDEGHHYNYVLFHDEKAAIVKTYFQRTPYGNAPDGLMGFRKNGPQKGFNETKYKNVLPVRVTWPDGQTIDDEIKGLNKPHAMARARRNWPGAKIEERTDSDVRFSRTAAAATSPAANPAAPASSPLRDRMDRIVDSLIYNFQDRFKPLKDIQKRAGAVPESQDASLAEERYSGTVRAKTDEFEAADRDPLVKAIHDSGVAYDDVEDFLHALHAPSRNKAMREINPTEEELKAKIDRLSAQRDALAKDADVEEYLKLRRELRQAEGDVEDGIADESLVNLIKRDIAQLKKVANVKDYVDALDQLKGLRLIKPFKGDNTALSGMSDDESAAILAKIDANGSRKALDRISAIVDRITSKTRQIFIDSGLEKAETIEKWKQKYDHYIPLHRDEVGGDPGMPKIGQGFNIRGKESKRAVGSTKEVTDILAHVVAQHEAAIIRAEKSKVDKALFKFAQAHPDPKLWSLDTAPMIRSVDQTTGLAVSRVDPTFKNRDEVLTLKIDGEEHTITFTKGNEEGMKLVASMKNLSSQQLGEVTQMVGRVTRFLATMNTTMNPVFVARNFLRDIQTAYVNLSDTELAGRKKEVFKNVPKAVRGMWAMARGDKKSQWASYAAEFKAAGGQTGWMEHYNDIGERADALKKDLGRMGPGKWNASKRTFRAWLDIIEDANTAVENGVRLAAYVQARKSGMSEGRAAQLAKNLTVNFNARGAKSVELNSWYMFMNASIQGSARLIKALSNKEVQKIVGGIILSGFLMDVLARAFAGDDDDDGENDYDQLPEHVKAMNFVLWVDDRPVTIPMPYGYNFFASTGRKMSEMIFRENYSPVKSATDLVSVFLDAFSPTGQAGSFLQYVAPTVADPAVQWAENRNFAGQPLRRPQNPFGPPNPEYQMGFRSTSAPAKWLAEALNDTTGGNEVRPGFIDMNPAFFDFAVTAVAGGAGRTYLQAISLPIKAGGEEEIQAREVPFANILLSAKPEYQTERKYIEAILRVETAKDELKTYRNKGDKEMVARIREDHGGELKLALLAAHSKAVMTQLRNREALLDKVDPERRARLKKDIEDKRRATMAHFNKKYREATAEAD